MVLILSACSKQIELYKDLNEQEANEIIAALDHKKIDAKKMPGKAGVVSVVIPEKDISTAVRWLEHKGLPRPRRGNLGDIFRKEGVISTPLEERARYIHALSQELETTISHMRGVVFARVHVVLPERVAPGEPLQAASASVFIQHEKNIDPDVLIPSIQKLVGASLPGMAGEDSRKVVVVLLPVETYEKTEGEKK
jgi:type III secretion protein J